MMKSADVKKSTIWISYDLGVRGDYEGLYRWLDDRKAKECVNSVALLVYKHSGKLLDSLKLDLEQAIEVTKRTRIYVVYHDAKTKKMKGFFLFGGRRSPAWTGFSEEAEESEDSEE